MAWNEYQGSTGARPPVPSHAARIENSLPRAEDIDNRRFARHLILTREGKGEGEEDRVGAGREGNSYLIMHDLITQVPKVTRLPCCLEKQNYNLISFSSTTSLCSTPAIICSILEVIHNYEANATMLICCKIQLSILQTM